MRRFGQSTVCLAAWLMMATLTLGQGGVITGTEIFITHNWGLNGITTGTTGWDNLVVRDGAGNSHTISFSITATTGTGIYGPIVTDGAYLMEAIWLTNTGITAAHFHSIASGGNPTFYEGTHGNGITQNQGVRITRVDGAPLSLASIDYLNAFEPFLIGTSFTMYSDLLTWTNFGPMEGLMLNQPTWTTYTFIPPDVDRVFVDEAAGFISFSPGTGTFTVFTSVSSYVTVGGNVVNNPAIDPLVGASLTMTGTYVGADIATLTNIVFTSAGTNITVNPGIDQLLLSHQFFHSLGQGDVFGFGGPNGATPIVRRSLGQNGPGIITRIGGGSGALDNLAGGLMSGTLSPVFSLLPGGPRLRSLEKNYVLPTVAKEMRFRTNNLGSAQIGIIGLAPFAEVWNLPVVGPANSVVGSGSFFGLTLNGALLQILTLPTGIQPFHVTANFNGIYFYGVPSASVPVGLVVDLVTLEIAPGAQSVTFNSGVQRLTF